jgi:hypothetical protein
MLRGVAENKDAAERKSSVLEAADALDIAIKRVQYGIQMVFLHE